MKKTQQSTNLGVLAMLGGFLAIYQDVRVMDFFEVFKNLTYGDAVAMIIPFVSGLWAIIHNEDNNSRLG